MLLRRVIEHVKSQNWTAVVLDFVIVVVGVFIGIQVSNWNAARGERALEHVYLERLHDEAFAGVSGFLEFTDIVWTERGKAMHAAYDVIFASDGGTASLDPAQCNALAHTHTIIAFPHQFPSLEELISSGRFGIIQDQTLRDKLTEYVLMQKNSRSLVDYFTADYLHMALEFPEYFQTRLVNSEAAWAEDIDVECYPELMREDQHFMNSLTEAMSRFNGYYNVVLRPEIDSVKAIHAALDVRLQIDHGEDQ